MGDLAIQESVASLNSDSNEGRQYLTFFLSNERYAIDILGISEIIGVKILTELPLSPHFIRGVISRIDSVLTLIDLSAYLVQWRCEITTRSCIVVIDQNADYLKGMGEWTTTSWLYLMLIVFFP